MTGTEAVAGNTGKDQEQLCLVKGCSYCLQQCDDLLDQLTPEDFTRADTDVSSIGAHIRHILERFQSVTAGLPDGLIDYDARKRELNLEQNLEAAAFTLTSIRRRFEEFATDPSANHHIAVRESVHPELAPAVAQSTVARELMGLISHTTHHLAIIGLLARPLGYRLPAHFGKAASTRIFEAG